MLYYFFNWLDQQYDFPGAGMFQYLSFRAGLAVLLSLIISIIIGKRIITFLQKQQIHRHMWNDFHLFCLLILPSSFRHFITFSNTNSSASYTN